MNFVASKVVNKSTLSMVLELQVISQVAIIFREKPLDSLRVIKFYELSLLKIILHYIYVIDAWNEKSLVQALQIGNALNWFSGR